MKLARGGVQASIALERIAAHLSRFFGATSMIAASSETALPNKIWFEALAAQLILKENR